MKVQRHAVDVDTTALKRFVIRASQFGRQKIALHTTADGQLLLEFEDKLSKGTEYILAGHMNQLIQCDVSCSIKAIKPVLEKISTIVLDYVHSERVLILRDDSDDLQFQFLTRI